MTNYVSNIGRQYTIPQVRDLLYSACSLCLMFTAGAHSRYAINANAVEVVLTKKNTVGSHLYLVYPYEVDVLHMFTSI